MIMSHQCQYDVTVMSFAICKSADATFHSCNKVGHFEALRIKHLHNDRSHNWSFQTKNPVLS